VEAAARKSGKVGEVVVSAENGVAVVMDKRLEESVLTGKKSKKKH
jgi:hypothetical protein